MKASEITSRARKEIKDFIVFEMAQLYKALKIKVNFAEDEDYRLNFGEKNLMPVKLIVYIDDSYENDAFLIQMDAKSIIMTLDDDIYLIAGDNEDEIHWTDIQTDDLVKIANALEMCYKATLIRKVRES